MIQRKSIRGPRFAGQDLIRALAIFSVIGGHFFMNAGFQQEEFAGASMFVQVVG